jgi:hypothetical protein
MLRLLLVAVVAVRLGLRHFQFAEATFFLVDRSS